MKSTAQKIIDFRKSGNMKTSSTAQKTFAPKDNGAITRALCLLIASNIDKENPFRALPMVVKYVVFNEIPMNEMVESTDKPPQPSPTVEEASNNPFLEGLV